MKRNAVFLSTVVALMGTAWSFGWNDIAEGAIQGLHTIGKGAKVAYEQTKDTVEKGLGGTGCPYGTVYCKVGTQVKNFIFLQQPKDGVTATSTKLIPVNIALSCIPNPQQLQNAENACTGQGGTITKIERGLLTDGNRFSGQNIENVAGGLLGNVIGTMGNILHRKMNSPNREHAVNVGGFNFKLNRSNSAPVGRQGDGLEDEDEDET